MIKKSSLTGSFALAVIAIFAPFMAGANNNKPDDMVRTKDAALMTLFAQAHSLRAVHEVAETISALRAEGFEPDPEEKQPIETATYYKGQPGETQTTYIRFLRPATNEFVTLSFAEESRTGKEKASVIGGVKGGGLAPTVMPLLEIPTSLYLESVKAGHPRHRL